MSAAPRYSLLVFRRGHLHAGGQERRGSDRDRICEHGPRTVIHTLQKGEVFGWAALVPPHQRTGTARCVEKASVICLNGKDLIELLDKNDHMGYVVMKNLSGILSNAIDLYHAGPAPRDPEAGQEAGRRVVERAF